MCHFRESKGNWERLPCTSPLQVIQSPCAPQEPGWAAAARHKLGKQAVVLAAGAEIPREDRLLSSTWKASNNPSYQDRKEGTKVKCIHHFFLFFPTSGKVTANRISRFTDLQALTGYSAACFTNYCQGLKLNKSQANRRLFKHGRGAGRARHLRKAAASYP